MREISEQRRKVEKEAHRHVVLRGWRGKIHWENFKRLERQIENGLKLVGLYKLGFDNLFDFQIENIEIPFKNLPEAFDGFRLLWLSDFHIDPLDGLAEAIVEKMENIQYDIAIFGGDYSFAYELSDIAVKHMQSILKPLLERNPVYGILGNHDSYEIGHIFEQQGVNMLLNENMVVEKDGERLFLVGIDDCHYFQSDDLNEACENIDDGNFRILLSHSPEIIKKTRRFHFNLCLCGHTHGGQVCLPGGFPLVTCASVRRHFTKGLWHHHGMIGYTSQGVGASGIPVRFFCPPEITVITLKRN